MDCGGCGTEVPLTAMTSALSGIGYLCSKCNNYVAISYGNQAIHPAKALMPTWNHTIGKRGEPIDRGTLLTFCRTKRDYVVVTLLQVMAKEEDPRFMFVRDGEQSAGLLLSAGMEKYLGFLVWNVSEGHAILRQIFIVPEERRKGLASRMVTYWKERYADKVNSTFGIESPNEKAINLHHKLGHVRLERESVRGLKCFFVSGF